MNLFLLRLCPNRLLQEQAICVLIHVSEGNEPINPIPTLLLYALPSGFVERVVATLCQRVVRMNATIPVTERQKLTSSSPIGLLTGKRPHVLGNIALALRDFQEAGGCVRVL